MTREKKEDLALTLAMWTLVLSLVTLALMAVLLLRKLGVM